MWKAKTAGAGVWRTIRLKLVESKEELGRWAVANKNPIDGLIISKTCDLQQLQTEEGILDLVTMGQFQREMNGLIEHDETHLRQHAKVAWLKYGDRNSKFFHTCINQHWRANEIHFILDEEGSLHSSPEEVEKAFILYFQRIFSTSSSSGIEACLATLPRRVTPEMNEQLTNEFTKEKLVATL